MTREQFFDVFRSYNEAVWPAPAAWFFLALCAVYLATRGSRGSSKLVVVFLSALWLWSGVAYHIVYHAPHNPAAYLFGGLFVAQAAVLLLHGVLRSEITFAPRSDASGMLGALLIGYSLVIYPIIGWALGHEYPASPTFGVPCPVTLFTYGVLLWSAGRVSWQLLVVPLIWSFIAIGAALSWGVLEDLLLPIAAVLVTLILFRRSKRPTEVLPEEALQRPGIAGARR